MSAIMTKRRVLLLIATSTFDQIEAKGTSWMFTETDEGGYFDKVIRLHPAARKFRKIKLSDRHVIYEIGWNPHRLFLWTALVAGLWLCWHERATVVRSTSPFVSGLWGWIIARTLRKPFCVSMHSDYQQDYEIWGHKKPKNPLDKTAHWVMRFVLSRADMVMAISESWKEYAIRNGAKRETARVTPHGVSAQIYDGERNDLLRKLIGDRTAVAVVTRLAPDQYIDDLAKLAKSIRDPSIVFMVVGTGEDRYKLEQLSNVILLGHQTRKQVAETLASCDIGLCFSSGLRTIEMALARLPIVAYDVDWQREVVINGKCGMLVAEHDVPGLANSIMLCASSPKDAKEQGECGRRYAAEYYSPERTRQIKIDCYEELINVSR